MLSLATRNACCMLAASKSSSFGSQHIAGSYVAVVRSHLAVFFIFHHSHLTNLQSFARSTAKETSGSTTTRSFIETVPKTWASCAGEPAPASMDGNRRSHVSPPMTKTSGKLHPFAQ